MDSSSRAIVLWPALDGLLASASSSASWDAPRLISSESSFESPTLAFSAPGAALALWAAAFGGSRAVFANRLETPGGWASPETVWSIGASDVSTPALAVASNGFALAAWAANGARVWWTTFDPSRGWAAPRLLGLAGDATPVYGVVVARNAAGAGVVVWIQHDTVFASHYTGAEGPGVPEVLGRGACQGLAIDSAGNAVALLNQPLVPQAGLVVRVYRSGGGWDEEPIVAADDAGGAAALSMDASGNAWVIWADGSGGIWSRRYLPGEGLLAAQEFATGSASRPQVVADDGGGAIAVWLNRNPGGAPSTILSARFVAR
jgi:hypothetical protein